MEAQVGGAYSVFNFMVAGRPPSIGGVALKRIISAKGFFALTLLAASPVAVAVVAAGLLVHFNKSKR